MKKKVHDMSKKLDVLIKEGLGKRNLHSAKHIEEIEREMMNKMSN